MQRRVKLTQTHFIINNNDEYFDVLAYAGCILPLICAVDWIKVRLISVIEIIWQKPNKQATLREVIKSEEAK